MLQESFTRESSARSDSQSRFSVVDLFLDELVVFLLAEP
jgi:hypothetical protein